jgi:hypothetical protein
VFWWKPQGWVKGESKSAVKRGGRGSSILVLRTQCTATGVLGLERYGRTTVSAGVTVSVVGFKGVAAGRWRGEENEKD